MNRMDELKERVRQKPLIDRLEESRRRIGDMCAKGRCPKMTIPVQYNDDDFYINTTLFDAQEIITQLQGLVREVENELAGIVRRNQGGYIGDHIAVDKCLTLIRTHPTAGGSQKLPDRLKQLERTQKPKDTY